MAETSFKGPAIGLLVIAALLGLDALVDGGGETPEPPAAAVGAQTAAAPTAAAPTSSKASPAQMLADLDHDSRPASDYQRVLDQLTPKCTEDEYRVASLVYASLDDLQKNGVRGGTEYSTLRGINDSVPAGSPRMECQQIAAAWLVLQEG